MYEKLHDSLYRYNRTNSCFSIIMIDVDRFKFINDNYGHNVGDLVLKRMVEVIMKRIRKTDILSRWGGDEFVLLLPDTRVENARLVAEDIRSQINKIVIQDIPQTTVSLGVADNKGCQCVDTVIKKVDDLMYQAKFSGRNRVSS